MKKEIKAVLFDMDGTITDTEKYYFRCWPKSFHAFGYEDYGPEDALYARSLNHADANAHWQQRFDPRIPMDQIRAYNQNLVNELIATEGIDLKPGVEEILAFLRSRQIKSAVVTATQYQRAMTRLAQVHLDQSFDTVISASMVEKGKPHPDVYLYAASEIGAEPGQCIAVEDSPNGIRSAAAAGCIPVMVPDLTEPTEDLQPLLYGVARDLTGLIPMIEALSES
jgi:DNA helicase-2/ATP-dependent DNA helicase PcrA